MSPSGSQITVGIPRRDRVAGRSPPVEQSFDRDSVTAPPARPSRPSPTWISTRSPPSIHPAASDAISLAGSGMPAKAWPPGCRAPACLAFLLTAPSGRQTPDPPPASANDQPQVGQFFVSPPGQFRMLLDKLGKGKPAAHLRLHDCCEFGSRFRGNDTLRSPGKSGVQRRRSSAPVGGLAAAVLDVRVREHDIGEACGIIIPRL